VLKYTKGSNESVGPSILVADLSDEQYAVAASSPLIANVYKEGIAYVESIQNSATWGLDRIDQFSNTLDGNYSYSQTGQGVDIYVIDSGIIETHTEFIGRIPYHGFAPGINNIYDCHGHGTHVAGTAAGTTYGVAKSARIIPVRVFGCSGSGSYSDIESAIAWVISDHTSTTPAVANLSIGFWTQ
jgi:subtilisin family serine protease